MKGAAAALDYERAPEPRQSKIMSMDKDHNPPPPPPPPPPQDAAALRARVERLEAIIDTLSWQLNEQDELSKTRASRAATRDELKNNELRVKDLADSVDGLKRTFAREAEMAARLEQAETVVTGLKGAMEGQLRKLRGELAALAPRDAVDELRVGQAAALTALEEVRRVFEGYYEEISGMAAECRRTLGEAQGLLKSSAQAKAAERADEHLGEHLTEAVNKLNARLSEAETAMHAGLSELSSRFTANEVLYSKMFASAEERLAKGFEPRLKEVDAQLRWLRENLIRLSDDYTVSTERKLRALEAKYSAFEAISKRMDSIDAALKKGGRIGLP